MSPFRRIPDPDRALEVDWSGVGLRRTLQREVVLGLVRTSTDHPTAEWIHHEARRVIPDISLATVYRTLRILKEKGLIYEFSGGSSPARYDGVMHDHDYVRCVCCGLVSDVDLPGIGELRRRVAERTGFSLGRVPLLFQGLCAACASKGGSREARDRARFDAADEPRGGAPTGGSAGAAG